MTEFERRTMYSILNILTDVSFKALIGVEKLNNASPEEIELIIKNREAIDKLKEELLQE